MDAPSSIYLSVTFRFIFEDEMFLLISNLKKTEWKVTYFIVLTVPRNQILTATLDVKCKVLHLGPSNPPKQSRLLTEWPKGSFGEKGSWWRVSWREAHEVEVAVMTSNKYQAALAEAWPTRQENWSPPSIQHSWDHTWSTVSSLGPPPVEDTVGQEKQKATKMVRGVETHCTRKCWGSWVYWAWRRREYNCCFQLPNGGCKRRWRQTLLGGVQSKDKGHILQQGEVLLATRGKRNKSVHSVGSRAPEKAAQSCGISVPGDAQGLAQPIWLQS